MLKFSYKKVIDKDIENIDFMKKKKLSKSIFYKIKNVENVTTDFLLRICNML